MHPLLRGSAAGIGIGLMIYMIALVIGVTLSRVVSLEYLLFDVCWQCIEQALGGLFIGLIYMYSSSSYRESLVKNQTQ
jgi:hypothetical protein